MSPNLKSLAIAYDVKRKAKKKAAGGTASQPVSRPDTGFGAIIAKAEGGNVKDARGTSVYSDDNIAGINRPRDKFNPRSESEAKRMDRGLKGNSFEYRKETSRQNIEDQKKIHPKLKGLSEGGEAKMLKEHKALLSQPQPKSYLPTKIVHKAQGGSISANNEKRPMPSGKHDDEVMVSHNSAKKAAMDDSWTDTLTEKQAISNNGRKVLPIKRPRMVPSDAFSTRLYDSEGKLQDSAKTGPYDEQPPRHDDEEDADRQGPIVPDMQDEHNNGRKPYAKGGEINEEISMHEAENDDLEHPKHLEEDEDELGPSEKEFMSGKMMADGGEIGHTPDDSESIPEDEEEMEHHDSIAAAIMAKRDRRAAQMSDSDMDEMLRLYEGGEIRNRKEKSILSRDSIHSDDSDMADLSRNQDEDANSEDQLSFNALRKENYNDSNLEIEDPRDSAQHGDDEEMDSHDKHDMVSAIRAKLNKERRFK
jgi:hypothetical protein